MSKFICSFLDGTEHEIHADYYAIEKSVVVNLRKEKSIVIEYIFYKNEKVVLRIPHLFVEKIREVS